VDSAEGEREGAERSWTPFKPRLGRGSRERVALRDWPRDDRSQLECGTLPGRGAGLLVFVHRERLGSFRETPAPTRKEYALGMRGQRFRGGRVRLPAGGGFARVGLAP
jgi:hypothetical protein